MNGVPLSGFLEDRALTLMVIVLGALVIGLGLLFGRGSPPSPPPADAFDGCFVAPDAPAIAVESGLIRLRQADALSVGFLPELNKWGWRLMPDNPVLSDRLLAISTFHLERGRRYGAFAPGDIDGISVMMGDTQRGYREVNYRRAPVDRCAALQ